MKLTLLVLGGALAHFAASIPVAASDPEEEYDDLEERDDDSCEAAPVYQTTTVQATKTSGGRPILTVYPKQRGGATSSLVSVPTSSPSIPSGSKKNPFTTNGIKAGLSGYPGINLYSTSAMNALAPYIGWYSDYTPNTPNYGNVEGIPMLWGDGTSCTSDTDVTQRVDTFYETIANSTPKMMFGFYEPDCNCPMSSYMPDPVYGAKRWNQMLAPLAAKGTILGSPSMCKQTAENWLTPFRKAGLNADWQVTSIHVNVNSLAGVQKDVEYYAAKYGKPIWISELACVSAGNGYFNPCTDQGEINNFINTVIPWLEANSTVVGYAASNGEGLGNTWPLTNGGSLTATGVTYLNALKNLHH